MKNGMIKSSNETKAWCLNGNIHHIDDPAVEFENGTKHWHLNDKFHHVDGPAAEYVDDPDVEDAENS